MPGHTKSCGPHKGFYLHPKSKKKPQKGFKKGVLRDVMNFEFSMNTFFLSSITKAVSVNFSVIVYLIMLIMTSNDKMLSF